jgi:hypothetical protein
MTDTHPPEGEPRLPFWPQDAREEQLAGRAMDSGYYLIPHGGEWLLVDFGAGHGSFTEHPTLDDVEKHLAA